VLEKGLSFPYISFLYYGIFKIKEKDKLLCRKLGKDYLKDNRQKLFSCASNIRNVKPGVGGSCLSS
jgi:hypothetical protein